MPPAGDRPAPGWRGRRRPLRARRGARGCSHPVHRRPRQSRADAAQGRQGRSYSGALHLDAPEPRPLHGVWVDGGRDGSWGEWWVRLVLALGSQPTEVQDAPMDQGMAALLAGVGGLVGSSVGALAAWRGARIGAQKAVEAVRVQVKGQSEAEHQHWAREERKTSWMTSLKAARQVTGTLHNVERGLRQGQGPSAEARSTIADEMSTLAAGVVELSVWGPDEGADACGELHTKIFEQVEAVMNWGGAIAQGRDTAREQEAYAVADENRRDAYSLFLYLARRSLRDTSTQ